MGAVSEYDDVEEFEEVRVESISQRAEFIS